MTTNNKREVHVSVVGGLSVPRRGHVAVVHPSTTYSDLLSTARLLFANLSTTWRHIDGSAVSRVEASDVGIFLVARENELLGALQDADVGPYREKQPRAMRLLQKAEIEGVDLVFLPYALLPEHFGVAAESTMLLHDRRRRLALLDLAPLRPIKASSTPTHTPTPRSPHFIESDAYDDSTIDDSMQRNVHTHSNRSALRDHDDEEDEDEDGNTTETDDRSDTEPDTASIPASPRRRNTSSGTHYTAKTARTDAGVDSDTESTTSTTYNQHSPVASRRNNSAVRNISIPDDMGFAVSSDGGDSITSPTPPARATPGGDDDDDANSSQSSSSRRGRYRPRNGPRECTDTTPTASTAVSPRLASSSARANLTRTQIEAEKLIRRASESSKSILSSPPSAAPAIAALGQRQQHKLQQMLGDEVALAGGDSASSATELAIQEVLETVSGATKLQLRKPWRTFLMSTELAELEAPRDGHAQASTPVAKLKVLRTARYYLFSDILLRCWPGSTKEQRLLLHDVVSLDSVLLVDLDATGANTTFQIIVMGGLQGSEKLTLRTRLASEKQQWLHYLTAIVERKLTSQMRSYKATQLASLADAPAAEPRRAALLLGLVRGSGEDSGSRKGRRRRRTSDMSASRSPRSPRSQSPTRTPRSPRTAQRDRAQRSARSKSPERKSREGAISSILRPLRRDKTGGAEYSLRVAPIEASEVPTARRECSQCHSWLSGDLLVANGHYFHHGCLLCSSCNVGISPGSCYLDPSALVSSVAPAVHIGADGNRALSLLCTGCFTRLMKRSRKSSERDRGWMRKATSPASLSHAIHQQTTGGGEATNDIVAARRHAKLQRMLDDNLPVVRRHNVAQDEGDDNNVVDETETNAVESESRDSIGSTSSSEKQQAGSNSGSRSGTLRPRAVSITTRLPSGSVAMALGDDSESEMTADTHLSRGSTQT